MEKRTERNKELYKDINKKIAALAKKSSNEPFKDSHSTLRNINPQLFGEEKEVEEVTKEKRSTNKYLIAGIIFAFIIVIAIVIAVVI